MSLLGCCAHVGLKGETIIYRMTSRRQIPKLLSIFVGTFITQPSEEIYIALVIIDFNLLRKATRYPGQRESSSVGVRRM